MNRIEAIHSWNRASSRLGEQAERNALLEKEGLIAFTSGAWTVTVAGVAAGLRLHETKFEVPVSITRNGATRTSLVPILAANREQATARARTWLLEHGWEESEFKLWGCELHPANVRCENCASEPFSNDPDYHASVADRARRPQEP